VEFGGLGSRIAGLRVVWIQTHGGRGQIGNKEAELGNVECEIV
jgi:hypothetical protein